MQTNMSGHASPCLVHAKTAPSTCGWPLACVEELVECVMFVPRAQKPDWRFGGGLGWCWDFNVQLHLHTYLYHLLPAATLHTSFVRLHIYLMLRQTCLLHVCAGTSCYAKIHWKVETSDGKDAEENVKGNCERSPSWRVVLTYMFYYVLLYWCCCMII